MTFDLDHLDHLDNLDKFSSYRFTSFDNLLWSMLTTFQLITLDYWENVYNMVDGIFICIIPQIMANWSTSPLSKKPLPTTNVQFFQQKLQFSHHNISKCKTKNLHSLQLRRIFALLYRDINQYHLHHQRL